MEAMCQQNTETKGFSLALIMEKYGELSPEQNTLDCLIKL